MIIGYIKTIYMMLLLPILIGCAWRAILRIRAGILECYGVGTVLELFMFWVMAYIPIHRGMGVAALSGHSMTAGRIIGVVAIIISLISFRQQEITSVRTYGLTDMLIETKDMVKRIMSRKNGRIVASILVAAAIVMLVVSVLLIRSDLADRVPETVRMMLRTDRFYGYDPYSGKAYDDPQIPRFATEGWYAVLAYISGLDSYVFIHRVMASSLILAGYGIWLSLSRRFIPANSDETSQSRMIFFGVILGLYTLELIHNGPLQFKFYQNIWFGQTLTACIIMPAIFGEILIIVEKVSGFRTHKKKESVDDVTVNPGGSKL